MNAPLSRLREIFASASECASAQERRQYVDSACGGDAELREQVDSLLKAYNDAGSFLDHPAVMPRVDGDGDRTEAFETPAEPVAATAHTHPVTDGTAGDVLDFLAPPTSAESIGRLAHYDLLEVIGKGGFGTVLKAVDTKLRRVVAIKVLVPQLAANGAARQRFIREAQTAAAVKNEHVVSIHSVDDESQLPFLVMEIIDGISLQDKLDRKGPLSLREILRIGMQTAEGLAAAHKQGLVHRDIKPANILLENGVERVKITDFGVARAIDDVSMTQLGTLAGTPAYMSPEQAEGLPIDHRSDLFSLGSVLYALCTGHSPFRASGTYAVLKRVIDAAPRPLREVNNEIPAWLADIISKLHAKNPAERFRTAREVAELLGQRLADVQAEREIDTRADTPKQLRPRKSITVRIVVGVLLLLCAMALWLAVDHVLSGRRKEPPVAPLDTAEGGSGWEQLFNGRDLDGWQHRKGGVWEPVDWKVHQGIVTAHEQKTIAIRERVFGDFHARLQVRHDQNTKASFSFRRSHEDGTHAYHVKLGRDGDAVTGSLYTRNTKEYLVKLIDPPVPAGSWYTLEVIARGSHFIVKTEGKTVVDVHDPNPAAIPTGRLAFEYRPGTGVFQFRRVEIKEPTPTQK